MGLAVNVNNLHIKVMNREEWKQLKKFLGKADVHFVDGDSVKGFKLDKAETFPLYLRFFDKSLETVCFTFNRSNIPNTVISVGAFKSLFCM